MGTSEGEDVVLECNSEAYPKSINYWSRDTGEIIVSGSYDKKYTYTHTYVKCILNGHVLSYNGFKI